MNSSTFASTKVSPYTVFQCRAILLAMCLHYDLHMGKIVGEVLVFMSVNKQFIFEDFGGFAL